MTSDRLIDLMVARLVFDHGGSKHRWRQAIGAVRRYSTATHPHCNWTVTPTGSVADVTAIETLLDDLRLRHPLLRA